MNKVRISNLQVFMGIFGTTVAYGHFIYTGLVYRAAGRDAWICLLAGFTIGFSIFFLHIRLAARFPRLSLIQYTTAVFGRWFGSLASWIYILFFLLAAALAIQELSIFMGLIYPRTPFQLFLVFEFVLVAWVVRAGGEVVTRVIQLLLPGLIAVGLIASMLSLKDKHPSNLLPMLDHTLLQLTHGTLIYVVMICDLIVFGMFYLDVQKPEELSRQSLFAIGILALMFIGAATGPIMIFGEKLTRALPYPTYAEIQYIQITGILERMDIAGVLLWTMGAYIRASVYVLGASRAISHFFSEQRETLYVFPVVVLVAGLSLSLMPLSREETHQFLYTTYPLLALAVGALLPVATLFVSLLRGTPQTAVKQPMNRT